jgi:alkyl sulfatase BDS1-like metallo-beta-lactamase superfamily hydrolase
MKRLFATLFLFALATVSPLTLAQDSADRFEGVEATIPVLSHDYYLGKDSGATHYWHGNDDGSTKFIKTGGNRALTEDPEGKVHPQLMAHSRKMDKGIFVIKDKYYKIWGYGLTCPTIIKGDDGLIVLDPMESADKMRTAMADFRKHTGIDLPVTGIVYSHWHMDHFGGVRGIDNIADDVKIIAHDTFMQNVVNNTMGGVGPALSFRVDYTTGTYLPVEADGRTNAGLGPDWVLTELTLIEPNTFVEGWWGKLDITISGVDLHVAHIPSESIDEIVVYVEEDKMLFAAEVIQGESFPNLHTIRGTRYRDPQDWYPGIDVMRTYDAEYMTSAHGRPIVGAAHVADTLTAYRDAIQFVYDQSIKAINNGATPEDLIRDIKLPPHLANHPWLGDLYGGPRHSAKQVFYGEMGWFDGDPTTLLPLHTSDSSLRYVELMGGKEKVMQAARAAFAEGEFQWSAELATHAVRVDLDDMGPRQLKADALRELGYRETNPNWRNWYMTSAVELEGDVDRSFKTNLNAPDIFDAYTEGQFVGALRFNLNADKALKEHYIIAFDFGDSTHALEVRRGVAQFHEYFDDKANATVKLNKETFAGLVLGSVQLEDAMNQGVITVEGDEEIVPTFFGMLDPVDTEPLITLR